MSDFRPYPSHCTSVVIQDMWETVGTRCLLSFLACAAVQERWACIVALQPSEILITACLFVSISHFLTRSSYQLFSSSTNQQQMSSSKDKWKYIREWALQNQINTIKSQQIHRKFSPGLPTPSTQHDASVHPQVGSKPLKAICEHVTWVPDHNPCTYKASNNLG